MIEWFKLQHKELGEISLRYRWCVILFMSMTLILPLVLSDTSFVQAQVSAKPTARGAHSITYDPCNNVTVIFGGFSLVGGWHYLGDTWTYSYTENSWIELELTPSPSARSNHAMVYCNETNEIILYGGQGPVNPTDTWSFSCDSQTWSQVATAIDPGVHHSLSMAYDSRENAVILFGGFGEDGHERDDTWKFNCETREWSELLPAELPLARYGHVMVYDEAINQVVMTSGNTEFQGHQDDTWTFDTSTNNWTELSPSGHPDPLKWPSMTYDSVDRKCVLFGGQIGDNAVDHTWIYDGQSNTWQQRFPTIAPGDRINTGLAFDSANNITILFGGIVIDGAQFDDTWVYSYEDNTWTEMEDQTGTVTSTGSGLELITLVLVASVITVAAVIVLIVKKKK